MLKSLTKVVKMLVMNLFEMDIYIVLNIHSKQVFVPINMVLFVIPGKIIMKRTWTNQIFSFVRNNRVRYNRVRYNRVRYNRVRYNRVRYNQVRYNRVRYNRLWLYFG